MSISVSNVVVTTDTFESWIGITNQLCTAMSTKTVTVESNTTGSTTTGNGYVNGYFSANVVAVRDSLRGGSVSTPANLTIISNTSITGGNLYISSNTYINAGNAVVNNANLAIQGGLVQVTSNVVFNIANSVTISPSYIIIGANTLQSTANMQLTAANVYVAATNTYISNGQLNIASNVYVTGLTTLAANATLSGTLQTIAGNVNFDTGTLFVDATNNRVGLSNTAPDATLSVTGTANVSGNTYVGGLTTLNANATLNGTLQTIAGNVNFDTGTLFVDATNNRVGLSNTAPDATLAVTGTANVSGATTLNGILTTNANATLNGTTITINGNTNGTSQLTWTNTAITFKSNSTVSAVAVSANSTVTNTAIGGNNFNVAVNNVYVTAGLTNITGNTTLLSNTSISAIVVTGNATATNVALQGTTVYINSNAAITGNVHTVSGNVNIDSGALFVDSVNNRVGMGNTTPDATLAVTGTANVSGATRFGGVVTFANATSSTNTVTITGQYLNVSTIGYFANLTNSVQLTTTGNVSFTGTQVQSTSNVYFNNSNTYINASNSAVTGGNLIIGSNTNVTGTLDISNKFAIKTDYEIQVVANANIGATTGSPVTVYSFDKTAYHTAKLSVQVNNGTSYQSAEILVSCDGTTPNMNMYGTVNSPTAANTLATFVANTSGSLVTIQAIQNYTSSAVKVVAHLIK